VSNACSLCVRDGNGELLDGLVQLDSALLRSLFLPLVSLACECCDERSESQKGLVLGMRITASVREGVRLVRRYKCVWFLLLAIVLPARRFAPRQIPPFLSFFSPVEVRGCGVSFSSATSKVDVGGNSVRRLLVDV